MKKYLAGIFAVINTGWVLYYTFTNERFGMFWFMIANIFIVVLVGTLSILMESPIRKTIRKNMTPEEKHKFTSISTTTGTALGTRVAPVALISAVAYMVFGLESLIYVLPVAAILLIALCIPVWRHIRRDTDHALLSSNYAVSNGIKTLKQDANNTSEGICR